MTDPETQICLYINRCLPLQSLLYDLDLMPEQLDRPSHDWERMLTLAAWFSNKFPETMNQTENS